jgi:hypothetical protein
MYYPPHFNPALALELGGLVNQAYAQHEAFQKNTEWSLEGGYEVVSPMRCAAQAGRLPEWLRPGRKQEGIPIGFVARRRRSLYVVFRGTATAEEWSKNLSFNLADCPLPDHGKVHVGFLEVYRSLRDSLMEALSKAEGKPRVYVTGHSLGGALATLAVPEIESNTGLRIKALYTFAAPRVGDDPFVQAFNRSFADRSFRLVNTSDIVPSVPLPVPIGMGSYFSHVETPVDFTAQFGSVEKNHEMETYMAALRQAENGRRGPGLLGFLWPPRKKL